MLNFFLIANPKLFNETQNRGENLFSDDCVFELSRAIAVFEVVVGGGIGEWFAACYSARFATGSESRCYPLGTSASNTARRIRSSPWLLMFFE